MRPFKFRIFYNGRLIDPDRIEFNPYGVQFEWFEENGQLRQGRLFNENLHSSDTPLLSQFTGFLDQDEKEIWEGDIVERQNGKTTTVEWLTGGWSLSEKESRAVRVIGNIYGKPDEPTASSGFQVV